MIYFKSIRNYQPGFTLIEVLVSMGVLGIILSALLVYERAAFESQYQIINTYQNVDYANSGVNTLIREIRNAKTADNGAYALESALDQSFAFYGDIDHDGQTEKVRYFLDAGVLRKGVIKPSGFPPEYLSANETESVVTENVANAASPLFYYYNGDWPADTANNPLATPARLANTKLVKIHLEILNDPAHPEQKYTLESYSQIRNLKTNL